MGAVGVVSVYEAHKGVAMIALNGFHLVRVQTAVTGFFKFHGESRSSSIGHRTFQPEPRIHGQVHGGIIHVCRNR